ncbi:C2 domain-containing protein 5 isoform X3 [Bacillus rossius redtenbacheri]|uniref:C2 domain-containing protein 5 isoform X3 n=1 Tax=Bacillus rossius redtenbacheri TaxID=93214 RepID=UPI002FDDFD55
MPGKVKVKIVAGRNLPVMDRASDNTDAYVEIKLGNTTYKTEVCRKSLNPQWNSEWYRFEVDDSELQDEPLQIRLMDYDTYSANDAIGKVYLDLNPLVLPTVPGATRNAWTNENTAVPTASTPAGSVMSGWIPVYDTMHGIRGEVNVIVKVEFFSDFNKFRQSSCGVQFFCSRMIPQCYHAQVIHGFVEELVVNDDPEYQWIDKIRTPRASNEARQTLFLKLSGELQRKIGLKALDLGGNAVIGYQQCFDLEGESGIVVRGIGTAVTLVRLQEAAAVVHQPVDSSVAADDRQAPVAGEDVVADKLPASPATVAAGAIHRRSSDSDLSITPKGNSLTSSDRSSTAGTHFRQTTAMVRQPMNQEGLDMLEYPFLTMHKFPPGFVLHLGGAVSSRSVKLLERITNLEEPETRDAWWTEVRMEVRSHCRALGCNVVLGYSEHTSICDDVCVLSAAGTAAVISLDHPAPWLRAHTASLDRHEFPDQSPAPAVTGALKVKSSPCDVFDSEMPSCAMCHIPYSESSIPFRVNMLKCAICRRGKVPDVLFTTIEAPESVPASGRGCLLQAYVCRPKAYCRGELNAKEISDGLPFLEYELHRLLINKLRVKGMNAIFGLKHLASSFPAPVHDRRLKFTPPVVTRTTCACCFSGQPVSQSSPEVQVGERMMIGLATGTAVFLCPLPAPPVPKISAGNLWTDDRKLSEMQKRLLDTVKKNRDMYQLKSITEVDVQSNGKTVPSDTDDSDDDLSDLDLAAGNKDTCVLEVDDAEDVDVVSLLMDPAPPEGFHAVNLESVPGLADLQVVSNLQMFMQVWRAKIQPGQHTGNFSEHFHRVLQTVYFKLRRMVPCALCNLQFSVELPEPDELQLSVLGMALGLGEVQTVHGGLHKKLNVPSTSKEPARRMDENEMIFRLEEDHPWGEGEGPAPPLPPQLSRPRPRSPQRIRPLHATNKLHHTPPRGGRYGVDITPLCYIPGGKIERYLGNLNFFFIRESTGIRECGGLSGFVHSFVTEVLAIVRAHVTALGGNAMVAYFISECILYHSPHKNQGQCLVNVGGDVVLVSYFTEDC